MASETRLALVTGVSGYIGSQLVPRLLDAGWRVRVLTRRAEGLRDAAWIEDVEVVEGDAQDRGVLAAATRGVDVAWFLIHSMSGSYDFAERDRAIATTFGQACHESGVSRIVYLGGLYPADEPLSEHLESRREVGRILMDSGVPTAVLQAGIVVGSGSVSYELLRAATNLLPAIVAPDWLDHRVQPVAIGDALHYLVAAADLPAEVNREFDVGGPDALSYRELIQVYAEVAGLPRRPILTVPVLFPRTTALWAGLLAPVPSSLATSLVESLVLDMVCREDDLAELVGPPPGGATDFRTAVSIARADGDPTGDGLLDLVDARTIESSSSPEALWESVASLGGSSAGYPFRPLWRARGLADRALGGPGFAMSRPDSTLAAGDVVDFWSVVDVEPGRSLRLRPRMRIPGRTIVELRVEAADGGSRLVVHTAFSPRGAAGVGYWFGFLPGHVVMFQQWGRRIVDRAEASV